MRNVLDHVARANPESAATALSAQDEAERDALHARIMAVAQEPPSAAPRARRGRRRRMTLAFAVAAVAALGIGIGVSATGDDSSFVDRAYAAISEARLLHVVEETSIDAPPPVLGREPFEEWRPTRTEAWFDRAGGASRTVVYEARDGRFVRSAEIAHRDGRTFSRDPDGSVDEVRRLDDGSTVQDEHSAVHLFERAYRDDAVRDDGEVTVDGRRLRRLVLEVPPSEMPAGFDLGAGVVTMLFDPVTLHPVEVTVVSAVAVEDAEHTVTLKVDYRVFEDLPATAEHLANLEMR